MEGVACGLCGAALLEAFEPDSRERLPCSTCGSTSRSSSVHFDVTVKGHASLRALGRHAGSSKRKWFIDTFSGSDWSHRLQRFVHKERTIDRDNDRYAEKVVDPETGEVLRDVEEPLSDHQGHGSAKR